MTGLLILSSMAWAAVDEITVDSTLQWWNSWEDPQVVSLIEEGLQNAPDVEIAFARVVQAEAVAKQLRASFLPSLALAGSMNTQPAEALGFGFGLSNLSSILPSDSTDTTDDAKTVLFTSGNMALQMGLPLDLWGSNYVNQRAASLDAQAAELDRENGMRTLAWSISNAYYDVLMLQGQHAIVQEQLQSGEAMLEIAELRQKRDDATILDVLQQRQQVQALKTQNVRISQQQQLAEQRLALLIGRSPSNYADLVKATEFPTFSVFDAVDVDRIVNSRLDVQSAEKRVQSAEKRRYVAMTKLLPTVALNGQLSRQANYRGEDGAEWNTLDTWSAGGSLNLTLFQGGSKWAAIDSANAGLVIAEENLRKMRLQAEQEVQQSLLAETKQQEILTLVDVQLDSAKMAYQEAVRLYQKGLTPYITVLSTQQAYQQAELTSLQTQREGVRVRLQTIQSLTLSTSN